VLREVSEPPPVSKVDGESTAFRQVTDEDPMISIDIPIHPPQGMKYTSNAPTAHFVGTDLKDLATPR
jgi:hypothetical protein